MSKYRPFPAIDLPDRTWPNQTITKAPIWCSVDLRDGNQALINPMGPAKKLEMFKALLKRAHRDEQHGGEEWVHIGFGSGESEAFPIYFNWKTTEMIEMLAIVFCDISSSFVA